MRQVIFRTSGGCHVQHGIHRTACGRRAERRGHIMPDEFESGMRAKVRNVLPGTGKQVVQRDHRVALEQQAVAHVGANESRGSRNNNSQKGSPPIPNSFNQFSEEWYIRSRSTMLHPSPLETAVFLALLVASLYAFWRRF